MNKIQAYTEESVFRLRFKINQLAKEHEIISVSLDTRPDADGKYIHDALVIYKA